MNKRIISILMTAMVSLSLLACGSNNAGESKTIPNITEAETTSTAAEAEEISTTVEAENTSTATEAEAGQNETTTENEITETTEVITKDSTETPATAEVSKEAENNIISPLSYEDFNINGFGYSNYVDLYGAGNGYEDDVERIAIMATNCTAYTEYPAQMSSDTTTSRGIKLRDSREQVIAAYGEPRNEVVYKSKAYNHDGLESQYNLCYCYIDEHYPEVFFNLPFSMDQNDNVLDFSIAYRFNSLFPSFSQSTRSIR